MNLFQICLLFVLISFVSTSCSPQSTPIPTVAATIQPTKTATIISSPTSTLEPTTTVEPTQTPVPIPGEIQEAFTGINLVWGDDFTYRGMSGISPLGWSNITDVAENRRIRLIDGDILKIDQPDNGFMYAFTQNTIQPGTGVFVKFKYSGSRDVFTLGIDSIDDLRQLLPYRTKNYHSFAFYVQNQKKLVHTIEGTYIKTLKSSGDYKLVEDTWYNMILAITPDKDYVIQIWNPQEPEKRQTTWYSAEKSQQYYFVGWIDKDRSIFLDDFTIFQFEKSTIRK